MDCTAMKKGHKSFFPRSEDRKFDAACQQIQESMKRYIDTHEKDESDGDEQEEFQIHQSQIIENILLSYENKGDLSRIRHHLEEAARSGSLICLICIETIKQNDFIWSCVECFCNFHLDCIQKWGKDSIFLQSQADNDATFVAFPPREPKEKKEFKWFCPKCRYEYATHQIPKEYKCFCGKQREPVFDPWILPHSCAEKCSKELKPKCGHTCLLLCHPGPCPPCPVMVQHPCHCPKANTQMRRCSSKAWSCDSVCGRFLECNQHKCQDRCHEGACSSCQRTSNQKCQCGSSSQMRPCASPVWHCDKTCNQNLPCGYHTCSKNCHKGSCGECPLGGQRSCPCGKKTYNLPCTVPTPTCGDTCGKALACGVHFCAERCHKGACPSCLQASVKRCSCGGKEKELPCSKTFSCEVKCKRIRDCRKHTCNRKCCVGDCPPCDQPCGKTLVCGQHKCESRCHQMRCYPCSVTHKISCTCGATSITVPCGREKKTPVPKCNALCKKKTVCHHPTAVPHRCHEGSCPPCRFVCGLKLDCQHECPVVCHDAVPIKVVNKQKRAGPWEKITSPYIDIQKLPCPPCKVPIPNTCYGKHETINWYCSELRPFSCGRKCGRLLQCFHHMCDLECHVVEGALDDVFQGTNCKPCDKLCSQPRREGCIHCCKLPCHSSPCPKCQGKLKLRCHCSILEITVDCHTWLTSSSDVKEKIRSCTNPCNKELSCSHRCQKECHSGKCSPVEECRKKVAVRCPCKRLRKEFACSLMAAGQADLPCDEICDRKKEEKRKADEVKRQRKLQEEEDLRKKEFEEYERFVQGGRRKRKKSTSHKVEERQGSWRTSYKAIFITALLAVIISINIIKNM